MPEPIDAAFIVDVLGAAEAIPDDGHSPGVWPARRSIASRYAELKRTLPFLESARQAKAEWLAEHLKRSGASRG